MTSQSSPAQAFWIRALGQPGLGSQTLGARACGPVGNTGLQMNIYSNPWGSAQPQDHQAWAFYGSFKLTLKVCAK